MEFVYVVKREHLFDRRTPHGLELPGAAGMDRYLRRIRARGFFVERRHAEEDASLKQIIPYCVVSRSEEVFLMRRLPDGGEARLHGKRSVGVGGHINPVDGDGRQDADVLERGMRRELEEEIAIDGPWEARTLGVLNDETTDVGSVHFGIVVRITTLGDVRVRETSKLEGTLIVAAALTELHSNERDSFESWSALVLDRLDDVLA